MKNTFSTKLLLVLSVFLPLVSFTGMQKSRPVFYIIGDSTVKNGDGTGKGSLWGWGSFMPAYFDTTRIVIENDAMGGRSSRTFITEGRWDRVLANLKEGDYVIMQFGHNDSGPLDDTARARGTIRGTGADSKEIYNLITKKQEVVYTYGWYMRKYIRDAKAKGAIAIVCSPIPRNDWKEGKVVRSTESYQTWAEQVAKEENAYFIDLNNLIAAQYETLGQETVKNFFPGDHTHTNADGARLNAELVAGALRQMKPGTLVRYMK